MEICQSISILSTQFRKGKKKIMLALCAILSLFVLFNFVWFGWNHIKYRSYIEGMTEIETSSVMSPAYASVDADGFDYNVKFPDYLSFAGNLAVGFPAEESDQITDGLIIWPKMFGGYEYGAMLQSLEKGTDGYMFYIDAHGNAIDAEYQAVAERYSEVISELLSRAKSHWDLG